jgi:CRISPR system Cascade subunit CasC
MFLQIHYLTHYHAGLLNRDDAGLAKRITFGGSPRLRVSSQCQKRHWRTWMTERTDLPTGLRTRHFFSRVLKPRLVDEGLDNDLADALIVTLASEILTSAGGKDALDKEKLVMKQPVLFGRPEANYFTALIKEAAGQGDLKEAQAFLKEKLKAGKKNFAVLLRQAGITDPVAGFEAAMFGRFVTSDILSRVDAPVHVAHSFTTHTLDTEVDFFTVVDDLAGDETGAAHANDMELGAGLFYGYVVVDIPLLVSNLTGCERQAWKEQDLSNTRALLELLIQAITQVSPGAKLGATAPYARAECVVLEAGRSQPRSLANAFLKPISLRQDVHPMAESVRALASYLSDLEGMYGDTGECRYVASVHPWSRDQESTMPLREAVANCMASIAGERS